MAAMEARTEEAAPNVLAVPTRTARRGVVPYRLTVKQYLKMAGADIFPEGHNVELLAGIIVKKMTKNPPHSFSTSVLSKLLTRLLPADFVVREEKAVVLGKFWCPEPDIAVLRGTDAHYQHVHPTAENIVLLVEVSDSSSAIDRGLKWRGYAAIGVASYWIVNLPARRVEVYHDPAGQGAEAQYLASRSFGIDDEIPVTLDGREVCRVVVRNILPAILP